MWHNVSKFDIHEIKQRHLIHPFKGQTLYQYLTEILARARGIWHNIAGKNNTTAKYPPFSLTKWKRYMNLNNTLPPFYMSNHEVTNFSNDKIVILIVDVASIANNIHGFDLVEYLFCHYFQER